MPVPTSSSARTPGTPAAHHRLRASVTSRHLPLMLALTFSTGMVDAIGYLGLDRVFVGNMTGNVVILGMALTGADGLPIVGPSLALVGFLVGAAVAGRALRGRQTGWSTATTTAFATVATALAAVGVVLLVIRDPAGGAVALGVTTVMGIAMGGQAAAARHVAVKDVTTVVVTSTITGLAADSFFGNGAGAQLGRRGSAVLLILLGAAAGALLLRWHAGAGVLVAALVTAAVAVLGHLDHGSETARETT